MKTHLLTLLLTSFSTILFGQWNFTPEVGYANVLPEEIDFNQTWTYTDRPISGWSSVNINRAISSPTLGFTIEYSVPDGRFSAGSRVSTLRRSTTYLNESGRVINGVFNSDPPVDTRISFTEARAYVKYSIELPVFWRISVAAGPSIAWSQHDYVAQRDNVVMDNRTSITSEYTMTDSRRIIGRFLELSGDFRLSDRVGLRGAMAHAVYRKDSVRQRNFTMTTGLVVYL